MSLYAVELHPDVESDYTDAYHWYELKQTGLGERLLTNVRNKLDAISKSPETYGYKGNRGYREAKVDDFPYLVVYKVYALKRRVFVSSISHVKMHPRKKYRKNE